MERRSAEAHTQHLAEACIRKKCFFVTDTNYTGSASKYTRQKDVVCILLGCKHPMILRQWQDGTYTVVDGPGVDDTMTQYFLPSQNLTEMQFTTR